MKKYNQEIKKAAYNLYLRQYTPKEIRDALNLPNTRIIYYWAEKYNWAAMLNEESIESAIERRIKLLVHRDNKTEQEEKEIDNLISRHCQIIKAKAKAAPVYNKDSSDIDTNTNQERITNSENHKRSKKRKKNDVSHLTQEDFDRVASEILYNHQLYVREHKTAAKIRFLLKSRQIGFTFYFAFEAFENAVLTGQNNIFVSASKPQSRIFLMYIRKIAQQFFDVELSGGDVVRLSNHAHFIACANNVDSAQGYTGNVYMDEVFWTSKFDKLYEPASAMASLDEFKVTLFSTPSSKNHPAYREWTGDNWKGTDKKRKAQPFPKDNDLRMKGQICPDGIWRLVITLEDACKHGFDKINYERMKASKSPSVFGMLYMCMFIDSGSCVFNFNDLEKCLTDSALWQDFDIKAPRPFGNNEVWAGFDPSRSGDMATFVVIAPPPSSKHKFRILEVHRWQGLNFNWMAAEISRIKEKYNMRHIGIDRTGIGYGVFEILQDKYPREVVGINYSVNSKTSLVLKMVDLVNSQRIEWGDEYSDLAASFLSIHQTTTSKSDQITYVANRTETTGHADEFFAISHAVMNEPLNVGSQRPSTWIIN